MGIGGSSQDDLTACDRGERKTAIVQDSKCYEDESKLGSIIDHPRVSSSTSQFWCCFCFQVRNLPCREEASDSKILHDDMGSRSPQSRSLEIGATVLVRNYGLGTVRFNGETHFAPGFFIGVELDQPFGKHDGLYDGKRYFHAQPKTGVFVREKRLGALSDSETTKESEKSLKQQQGSYSFDLTLNDGLVTIHTSLNDNVTTDDCEIIRYRPNRLSAECELAKCEVSSSRWDEKFLSLISSGDKESKLELLFQLVEKEYFKFYPNHRLNASHQRTRSRRKGRSRSIKTSDQRASRSNEDLPVSSKKRKRGTKYDSVPTRILQQTSEKLEPTIATSVICLAQTQSIPSYSGHAKPNSSSVLSDLSDKGLLSCNSPDLRTPTPEILSNFGFNDTQNNSHSRLKVKHAADKLSVDASTIQDPETDYYSDFSGDDDGQVDLLMQDLEHERLMVKRKEERVKELEEELRGYDKELKEKTKSLARKSRQIERLVKECEELAEGIKKAETKAEAWQFEVLYGRGEQPILSLNV